MIYCLCINIILLENCVFLTIDAKTMDDILY